MHDFTATRADLTRIAYENDVDVETDENGVSRQILTDYSGRSMYGRRCVAIIHTSETRVDMLTYDLAAAIAGPDADAGDVRAVMADLEPEQDTLGYRTVTYWKNVAAGEFVTGPA